MLGIIYANLQLWPFPGPRRQDKARTNTNIFSTLTFRLPTTESHCTICYFSIYFLSLPRGKVCKENYRKNLSALFGMFGVFLFHRTIYSERRHAFSPSISQYRDNCKSYTVILVVELSCSLTSKPTLSPTNSTCIDPI